MSHLSKKFTESMPIATAQPAIRKPRKKSPPPFSLRLNKEEREKLETAAAGMPLGPFIKAKLFDGAAKGEMQEASLQFVIAFIKSIEPESEIETMLAAQMAAVHICALDALRRYLSSTSLDGKDSAERAMTKLTRTFTTQMEALKRHRAKARKNVRVERVNVESGGQAIVGDVSHRGEG